MTHRPIQPIAINGFQPGGQPRAYPIFEDVDPSTLLVDEGYQRESSERSLKLVRKIVAGWDWAKFKAPVAVLTDAGLELIDGQHTAIAAATHPDIERIPVMIVEVPEREQRASAFIGHNRDRVAVTAAQLHISAIVAGDIEAVAIDKICRAAGVSIMRGPSKDPAPGETMAVAAIGSLRRGRGHEASIRVLKVGVEAKIAPLTQTEIKAIDLLLFNDEYRAQISDATLIATITSMGQKAYSEAHVFRAAHPTTPLWKALAITWFKNRRSSGKAQVVEKPAGAASTAPTSPSKPPQPSSKPLIAAVAPITDNEDRPRTPDDAHSLIKTLSPEIQMRAAIVSDLRLSGHKGAITDAMLSGKKDSRPKLSGWLPGVFLLRCAGCDEKYQGDRKSRSCADCAYGCKEVATA